MHIWLFSSGGVLNEDIDLTLMQNFHNDNPKLTFVPSSFDTSAYYFEEFVERFERYGISNFNLLHLDQNPSKRELERALDSDMIYLSGGNTFYMLAVIKRTGFFELLRRYLALGNIVAGHSAGAIVLTPTINTASYPEEDCDPNEVELADWTGASLVPFEIFPHFTTDASNNLYRNALNQASILNGRPIYGVADGSAIAVNSDRVSFFGDVWVFHQGTSFKVSPAIAGVT